MAKTRTENIWERLLKNENFKSITLIYRKKIGIPKGGFNDSFEEAEWFDDNDLRQYNKLKDEYLTEVRKQYYYPDELRGVIERYLLENKFNKEVLKTNTPGCDIFAVLDNGIAKLTPGVYIKVDSITTLDDIKNTVINNSDKIKEMQERIKFKTGEKIKRIRANPYPKKNKKVLALYNKSFLELQLLANGKNIKANPRNKVTLISAITGYTKPNVRYILRQNKEAKKRKTNLSK